ncbi:LacI family DNA-binding transcriptional regulator [Streptomyces sp. DSM 44917]|uniref:LacI family DNA-binding transcriptional regulator n=1 Tax=Streptomyces boetiae TaxID=3075541 RepID=A0ABU2L4P3_9ACTN|nr:LacI family DNA-binding transcriptional regulator [Streptomyces sp. DSM 44917]MDT0306531.1 LacI family DNA-binding transcriptional regulator [Streptomyces sp. DSM 44917]
MPTAGPPPRRRVTMSDVARRAGVSATTASFVLAGRTDMRISEAARQRVQEAARALGYRPNAIARSLRTRSTRTIGLVSDTITTTPYAGEVIRGALEAARDREHLLFITETGGDPGAEPGLVDALLDRDVDAVIYAAMYTRTVAPPPQLRGRRVVLLNCLAPGFCAPSVVPDERGAGRTAARALLEAGHREGVWAVGGRGLAHRPPDGLLAGHDRLRGLTEELAAAGAALAGTSECGWEADDGRRAVAELLARGGPAPRALVCATDRTAFGAYQALADAGLRVPGDVSVLSFDDQDFASWLRPGLTTLALPHHALGRAAVDLVLGGPRPLAPEVHRVPVPLRARGSVGPPAAGGGRVHSPGADGERQGRERTT